MSAAVLIIDDEAAICSSLSFALEDSFQVYTANSGAEALACLAEQEIGIVLLDLFLGDEDGIALIEKIKAVSASTTIIMMTAYGSIKTSVEAIRSGAFYYVTKPIDMIELRTIMFNALKFSEMNAKVKYLNRKLIQESGLPEMVWRSAKMCQLMKDIERLGTVDSSVMIVGESGTGKELVARAIHYGSLRKDEAFEVVNCAAIPSELLESELFGHEKGAFTGAVQRKKGLFELADRGTLFLDEIAEMNIGLQAKLLRAVQEKEIMVLGQEKRRKVDVRIVSATNRNLKKMLEEGTFREDLYFRLNVVSLVTPPLRERKEDIPLLIEHFLKKYNWKMGRKIQSITPAALDILMNYDFTGNIRELENIIERAIVFSDGRVLDVDSLPIELSRHSQRKPVASETDQVIPVFVGENLADVEKKLILSTLEHLKGDKAAAARVLNISERKLWYKLKEYRETAPVAEM